MRTMARAGPVYRILQDKQDLRCHEDNQAGKGQAGRWRDRPSYHAAHRPRRHSHFLGRWTQVSCKEWVVWYGMVDHGMVWYWGWWNVMLSPWHGVAWSQAAIMRFTGPRNKQDSPGLRKLGSKYFGDILVTCRLAVSYHEWHWNSFIHVLLCT